MERFGALVLLFDQFIFMLHIATGQPAQAHANFRSATVFAVGQACSASKVTSRSIIHFCSKEFVKYSPQTAIAIWAITNAG